MQAGERIKIRNPKLETAAQPGQTLSLPSNGHGSRMGAAHIEIHRRAVRSVTLRGTQRPRVSSRVRHSEGDCLVARFAGQSMSIKIQRGRHLVFVNQAKVCRYELSDRLFLRLSHRTMVGLPYDDVVEKIVMLSYERLEVRKLIRQKFTL